MVAPARVLTPPVALAPVLIATATRTRTYTSRLLKGGALLADMRALMTHWDGTPTTAARTVTENALGHGTRTRVRGRRS